MRYSLMASIAIALGVVLPALAQTPAAGQMGPEARFKQLDRNGDGKVSQQEANNPRFDEVDADREASSRRWNGRRT